MVQNLFCANIHTREMYITVSQIKNITSSICLKYVYIRCIIIKQKVLRIWLVGRKRGVHLIMYLISVKQLTDPQPDVYLTVMMLIVQLTSLIIDFIGSMFRKHLYKYNT